MCRGNGTSARTNRKAARKYSGTKELERTTERRLLWKNKFIRADDVAQELSVSEPYAYKLIRKLNEELKAQGFITIAGRVNRQYFYEKLYGAGKASTTFT